MKGFVTFFILISLFKIDIYCFGSEELNSVIGFEIGMLKEDVITRLQELNIDHNYDELNNEISFYYDIIQDNMEKNLIRLKFTNDRLSQIGVYFYKYNMYQQIQASNRFKNYLIELDKSYNNGIHWKGKWKSKDGNLIVRTNVQYILENGYDVLIIEQRVKK